MDLSVELDQYEQTLIQINLEIAADVNQLRGKIVEDLAQYNHWRKQMRSMEISFMANILRPGYILKQAIRQKAFLEKEYTRIRTGIIQGDYSSIHELEADIRRVLIHCDQAYKADEKSYKDEHIQEKDLHELAQEINAQTLVEDQNEEQIIQNYKRFVLPAIHPDTSDTNPETFLTVFEAYQTEDYLLMEAYVAQYRGEIEIKEQEDVLNVNDTLSTTHAEYHRLSGRLERKLKALQSELTPEELENPAQVEQHLLEQRETLGQLIGKETQIIFDLRNKIEALIQLYIDLGKGMIHGVE